MLTKGECNYFKCCGKNHEGFKGCNSTNEQFNLEEKCGGEQEEGNTAGGGWLQASEVRACLWYAATYSTVITEKKMYSQEYGLSSRSY